MPMPLCRICGYEIDPPERARLRPICLECGEEAAKEEMRRKRTMCLPINKSTPTYISDLEMLKQLNPKRVAA